MSETTDKDIRVISPNTKIILGMVTVFHVIVLSFITAPQLALEGGEFFKKHQNLIRLDQFALKKEDLNPQVFSTNPGTLKNAGAQNNTKKNPLNLNDLSQLQIGGLGSTSINDLNNPKKNDVISDQVNEIKASDLAVNGTRSVSLMERAEARDLLIRHRKRMRTPEVQIDQENKLARLNDQLGSTLPGKLSDFNFSIVPNSKLSKEELNSIEKKFYAFHVRLSEKYTSTISSQFLRGFTIRPQLKNSLQDKHVLQAKIVYDKNGEIVLTKILKSSDANDVHATFEDILANFGLPNVPQELLNEEEQFTVYFTLAIN